MSGPVAGPVRPSLSEIDALCRLAARGAGYPWGLAEEAGRAARDLWKGGADGPGAVLAVLRALDGDDPAEHAPVPSPGPWRAAAGGGAWLCPIAAGAALSDRAHRFAAGEAVTLERLVAPVLLVPVLARARSALPGGFGIEPVPPDAAAPDAPVPLVRVCFGPSGAETSAGNGVDGEGRSAAAAAAVPGSRRVAEPGTWGALEAFAHRTRVPASEASRRGAGGAGEDG